MDVAEVQCYKLHKLSSCDSVVLVRIKLCKAIIRMYACIFLVFLNTKKVLSLRETKHLDRTESLLTADALRSRSSSSDTNIFDLLTMWRRLGNQIINYFCRISQTSLTTLRSLSWACVVFLAKLGMSRPVLICLRSYHRDFFFL